jgi:hypothetical protein
MALEIRHNKEKTFENESFRRIAKSLSRHFDSKGRDGLLIGNPYVEGNELLRPDVLLYTPHGTTIIDLKDRAGELVIPNNQTFETGIWLMDGKPVLAGSKSNNNPFNQLRKMRQRYRDALVSFDDTYRKVVTSHVGEREEQNTISTMVLFKGPILFDSTTSIPFPFNRWFFICDENNLINKIEDIQNNGKYSPELANVIKSIFRADQYNLDNPVIVDQHFESRLNLELNAAQKECLAKAKHFLHDQTSRVMIVKGQEKVGKSSIIGEVIHLASEAKIPQVEPLAVTKRIAIRLNRSQNLVNFSSIYSLIYGGNSQAKVEEIEKPDFTNEKITDTLTSEETNVESISEEEEGDDVELIPIRSSNSDHDDRTLFIVDEAQLLNSSPNASDLVQFGSGKLLDDFLQFINLTGTGRKAIFIGDPYQLSYGGAETSAINAGHIKHLLNMEPLSLEMKPSDKISPGALDITISKVASSIGANRYSLLPIIEGTDIIHLKSKQEGVDTLKTFYSNKEPIKSLSYTNKSADEINRYVRAKLLGKGEDLEIGDTLVLDNNVRVVGDDPFENPKFLNNGEILNVVSVGNPTSLPEIKLKKRKSSVTLRWRELVVQSSTSVPVKILSLENYRISTDAKLSFEEQLALRILHYRMISKEEETQPFESSTYYEDLLKLSDYKNAVAEIESLEASLGRGEKVKTLLGKTRSYKNKIEKVYRKKHRQALKRKLISSSPYFQYALLRYSHAITVHKSLGEYYDTVLLDANMGDRGRTNRDYFQWLYTGLTRARKKIYIVNSQEFHPLMKCKFEDSKQLAPSEQEPTLTQKTLGYELLIAPAEFKSLHQKDGISDDVINNAYTIVCWIKSRNMETTLDFSNKLAVKVWGKKDNSYEKLIFSYNLKGVPGKPRVENGTDEMKEALKDWITPKMIVKERFPQKFRSIYMEWETKLNEVGITWKQFDEVGFSDRIWLNREKDFLVFDATHNEEGFITYIVPHSTSNPALWQELKTAILKTVPMSLQPIAS